MSLVDWLAEMEIEDATFLQGVQLDDLTPQQLAAIDSCSNTAMIGSSSLQHHKVPVPLSHERPTIPEAASFSDFCCFENSNYGCLGGPVQPKIKNTSADIKEHVIAERKRRAKLSQQFTALTAIVPGIKKIDKVTVLDDSIKYMKRLKERVKTLEEQSSKKKIESAVFVKKLHIYSDSKSCSKDENLADEPLPQIEASVSDRSFLIRIHCEKRSGVLVKAVEETEKLSLNIVNCSAIPFGRSTVYITILAQIDGGFQMTVQDAVRRLRSSLIQFMGRSPPRLRQN